MNEQDKQQEQHVDMTKYGYQGNEGQYGQGQYDSEGKPDPHGTQAQQITPEQRDHQEISGQSPTGMISGADKQGAQKSQETSTSEQ